MAYRESMIKSSKLHLSSQQLRSLLQKLKERGFEDKTPRYNPEKPIAICPGITTPTFDMRLHESFEVGVVAYPEAERPKDQNKERSTCSVTMEFNAKMEGEYSDFGLPLVVLQYAYPKKDHDVNWDDYSAKLVPNLDIAIVLQQAAMIRHVIDRIVQDKESIREGIDALDVVIKLKQVFKEIGDENSFKTTAEGYVKNLLIECNNRVERAAQRLRSKEGIRTAMGFVADKV